MVAFRNVVSAALAAFAVPLAVPLLGPTSADAAPLPRYPPVDFCGEILEQAFVPTRSVPGRPGFSGSLGRDRTFPAHLRVVLVDWTGIDAETASRFNFLLGHEQPDKPPARLMVWLPTDNPTLLAGASAVCVEAYAVTGDEGGTWTHVGRIVPRRP